MNEQKTYSPDHKKKAEHLPFLTKLGLGAAAVALAIGGAKTAEVGPFDHNVYDDRDTIEQVIGDDTLWNIAREIAVVTGDDTRDVINDIKERNNITNVGDLDTSDRLILPDYMEEIDDYYSQVKSELENQG